jgi:hypothetical protein
MEAQSDVGISSDRITFLLGDMFDSPPDCVVVPCSTNANMSAEIRSHLDQIGVTLTKERLQPGEVVPTTVGDARGSPRMVLFAAVVADGKSTPEIVESAARQVGGLVAAGSVTAFPLLGAGSGRVAPEEAVEAMVVGFFSTAPGDAEMRIHVQSQQLYDRLRPVISGDEPAPLSLSGSLEHALTRLDGAGAVPAASLVAEILKIHPEYADGKGRAVRFSEHDDDPVRKPARQWIRDVRALFDPGRTPILHGRHAIIGLSLLDPVLRGRLEESVFLETLTAEVSEPLKEILTPRGSELRAARGRLPQRDEYVPTHTDNPAMVDELNRRGFARVLARQIRESRAAETSNAKRQKEKDRRHRGGGAFLVHLHAPWGAGKTSLLNFLAAELRERDEKLGFERWVVVNFNAWRHQRIAPPWWWLMTTLYVEAVRELDQFDRWRAVRLRIHEWWWRFRGGWPGYLVLLLGLGGLVLAWRTGVFAETQNRNLWSVETIRGFLVAAAAIVSPVLVVWGLVRAASRWIFTTSARGARRFIDNTHDPMRLVQNHLQDLVAWIDYEVIILIDDLDRCKAPYVVELLEGIQTLFRDVPVTYVVAADRDWLSESYTADYDKFASITQEPGRPMGYLFLEKTFQISTPLPTAGSFDAYWRRLLRSADLSSSTDVPDEAELKRATAAARADLANKPIGEARRLVARNPGTTPAEIQARRETVAVAMASERAAPTHAHMLEPFRSLLGPDPNPRMMKRLVNAYGLARGVETLHAYNLEDDEVREHETALWTILNLRWPRLGAYLARFPQHVDSIGGDGDPPSELPEDLEPLFSDRQVISVVRGQADEVKAHLDAQAILRLK